MAGAIAIRVAACVRVAGVIAISPARMRAAHGVTPENLLFSEPADVRSHSVVMVGLLELESMRGNAADLVASRNDETAKFLEIPAASHVSILFSGAAMRASQEWSARVLHLTSAAALPSYRPLLGALAGFVGILLIAGPFLRETAGKNRIEEIAVTSAIIRGPRLFLEFATGAILAVLVLRFWIPLKTIGLFHCDYVATFLLLLGPALFLMHSNSIHMSPPTPSLHP